MGPLLAKVIPTPPIQGTYPYGGCFFYEKGGQTPPGGKRSAPPIDTRNTKRETGKNYYYIKQKFCYILPSF